MLNGMEEAQAQTPWLGREGKVRKGTQRKGKVPFADSST